MMANCVDRYEAKRYQQIVCMTADARRIYATRAGETRTLFTAPEAWPAIAAFSYREERNVLAVLTAPLPIGSGRVTLYFVGADGTIGRGIQTERAYVYSAALDPSGTKLACISPGRGGQEEEAWVIDSEGQSQEVLRGHLLNPRWSSDGRYLLIPLTERLPEGKRRYGVARVEVPPGTAKDLSYLPGVISVDAGGASGDRLICIDERGAVFFLAQPAGTRTELPVPKNISDSQLGPEIRFLHGTDSVVIRHRGKPKDHLYLLTPPYRDAVVLSKTAWTQGWAVSSQIGIGQWAK
jgi:dipeptidyl aminopeptidase/acylaminoacyl peptidase